VAAMKLEMMTREDVELRVRQQTDPQMMAELGGPRPREDIERAHAKSLALAAAGRCWPLKIVSDGATSPLAWSTFSSRLMGMRRSMRLGG
jgi:hypothetical protein